MKSLIGLLEAFFTDVKRLHPEVAGLDRDLQTIKARLEDEGYGFVSVTLPAFGKSFDLGLSIGWMAHVMGFAYNKSLPRFLSGLTSLVFDAKTGLLLDNPSVECIVTIRQICYLFKKFLPSVSRLEHLEKIAMQDFREVDDSIERIAPFRLDLIERISHFVLPELDEFTEVYGKHGPGAVVEGYSPNQKWLEVYKGLLDFDPRMLDAGYDLQAGLFGDISSSQHSFDDVQTTGVARLVTVPKTCSALRTITVEPCLNQFVQQGYNLHLRRQIRKCRVLRQSLQLNSQVPNQVLALEGSRTGAWSTMDLSHASDLLSLQTVETFFARWPRYLSGILGCRTPMVNVNSNVITMKKYAGMGNATTFPVQSVIFASIALLAIVGSTKSLTFDKLERASRSVRVFGDDIIVRTEHYQDVAHWISSFGLKINHSKTFSVGNFRESCGVDAFRGVDVTPVYLRHDPVNAYKEPRALVSLVSTSNQLWSRCYLSSAEFLAKLVENSLGSLPLVRQDSGALGWHTRLNHRSIQRWNRSLHRFEVRSYVPFAVRRKDELDGYPALMKFFHRNLHSDIDGLSDPQFHQEEILAEDELHLKASVRRFSTKLRRRWVQV